MANPVSVYNWRRDSGGTAEVEGTVSASYVRNGSKITITITAKLTYGRGKYYGIQVAGTDYIFNQTGTVSKTFTYDTTAAKTYSYSVTSYIQTATSYAGETATHDTLTISVPKMPPQLWLKVNGAWKRMTQGYIKTV